MTRIYTTEEQRQAGERVTNALRAELGLHPVKVKPRDPKEVAVRPWTDPEIGRRMRKERR